jgi:transcription antitermination protein NusB
MLPQQKFREMVLQILYSSDFAPLNNEEMLDLLMNELEISKKNVKTAQIRAQQILDKLPEIDLLIASTSTSYEIDRIHQVTKNILRLALYELLYDPEIPKKVAIAEAIRLARKFGSPESTSFINAILDHAVPSPSKEDISIEGVSPNGQS